ncbi:hypothetical protein [Nocardia gipuzkoensis]
MTRTVSLLSTIARIHPQVWDTIVPRGPRFRAGEDVRAGVDGVALNPQPMPPESPANAFLIGAAEMAHDVARIATESEIRGESSVALVNEFIDDWCGTPWPRKWPWPLPGPRPNEGPLPEPWVIQTGRVVGGIVFASVGSRLADGALGSAFLEGAERLIEASGPG